jgi:hypothetical protein
MENLNTSEKLAFYNNRQVDSGKAWLLFLLLGWSYGLFGQMGKQILFYLTIGGFGFWGLYRLFTLSGAIKKHNRQIAMEVGLDAKEMMMLGLV